MLLGEEVAVSRRGSIARKARLDAEPSTSRGQAKDGDWEAGEAGLAGWDL